MKRTPVDLQKLFPMYHACPRCLAAHRCGLASRLDLEKVGVTLVDWERGIAHCVLIQHHEKSLDSFRQLTSFCSS